MSDATSALAFTPVKSSQIKDYSYDEGGQTLHVRFNSGGHYSYAGVDRKLADGFASAESPGRFFHQNIKPLAFVKHEPQPDQQQD